jgi:hypothetical protein
VEERALLNGANKQAAEAVEDVRTSLPFPLTDGRYDNGMEFINKPLLEWRLARHIRAIWSSPCQKNDNCFAEEKNYDVVRKTAGCFRFDSPAEPEALAEVYNYLCPRLITGIRFSGGQARRSRGMGYKKIHEKSPKTPFQRLIELSEAWKKARRN